MRAATDRFLLIARLNAKREGAALNPGQFCGRADAHPDGRGGEVTDIEMDAKALMTLRQKMFDGRTLSFRVEASDEREAIGGGTHQRVVVNVARFDARVQKKLTAR